VAREIGAYTTKSEEDMIGVEKFKKRFCFCLVVGSKFRGAEVRMTGRDDFEKER
jgi:hypothetical protein